MNNEINSLLQMSSPPADDAQFNLWLKSKDAVAFLKGNIQDDQFVLHATLPNIYINSILVPLTALDPLDIDDLMSWQCDAYSGWSVVTSYNPTPSVDIALPLHGTGSATLDKGEQLLFARAFDGRVGEKHYFELLQKFLHVSDLHYLPEKSAYCRLDRHGDIEEVVRLSEIPATAETGSGAIVTVKRDVLDRYAALTTSSIVRMFDFTRVRFSLFAGWHHPHEAKVTNAGDLFYRTHIEPGHASYMRGCQIVHSGVRPNEIIDEFSYRSQKPTEYASFIALDWKNGRVGEISCAPGATANYFTESDLPFEVTPAFFRPEVLSKYKADSDKYRMTGRTISCRGTWSLQTYDINEAGQVHTYLVYLRNLPFEEQLHWKSHNEAPKESISRRAFERDFKGSWEEIYDPLDSIKAQVRKFTEERVPWWTLHSEDAIDRSQYPVTASPDEWANEILHLDHLVVEPFVKSWFRNQLLKLGEIPDPQFGSLALAQECLIGWGQDPDDTKQVVGALRTLHELRSKLKGHLVSKSTLTQIRQQALSEHGSYGKHFRALCRQCDESLRTIAGIIAARSNAGT